MKSISEAMISKLFSVMNKIEVFTKTLSECPAPFRRMSLMVSRKNHSNLGLDALH